MGLLTMSDDSLAEAMLSILKTECLRSLPPDYMKPVRAKRRIRPMLGGSQAQMCLADGHATSPNGLGTLSEWRVIQALKSAFGDKANATIQGPARTTRLLL